MFKIIIYIFIILLFNNISHANNIKDFNHIKSHNVVYNLRVDKVLPSSKIHNAIGKMHLEVKEVCDGWVVNQNTTLDVTDKNGLQIRNEFRYSSWESYDFKSFRFISQIIVDEEEASYFEGEAFIDGQDSKVIFYNLNNRELIIPYDTIFPMQHYFNTYRGKDYFKSYNVFTGEDDDSLNHVTSFSNEVKIDGIIYKKVRSAIYKYNDISPEPIYEIELIIDKEGIVQKVIFDYLSYRIVGSISSIEFIDKKVC